MQVWRRPLEYGNHIFCHPNRFGCSNAKLFLFWFEIYFYVLCDCCMLLANQHKLLPANVEHGECTLIPMDICIYFCLSDVLFTKKNGFGFFSACKTASPNDVMSCISNEIFRCALMNLPPCRSYSVEFLCTSTHFYWEIAFWWLFHECTNSCFCCFFHLCHVQLACMHARVAFFSPPSLLVIWICL